MWLVHFFVASSKKVGKVLPYHKEESSVKEVKLSRNEGPHSSVRVYKAWPLNQAFPNLVFLELCGIQHGDRGNIKVLCLFCYSKYLSITHNQLDPHHFHLFPLCCLFPALLSLQKWRKIEILNMIIYQSHCVSRNGISFKIKRSDHLSEQQNSELSLWRYKFAHRLCGC